MRLNFRWKLFLGFFGFALVVAGLLVAWLLAEVSGGMLFPGSSPLAAELRKRLLHFLLWALLILAGLSIPPALWIASRLNRPLRLLDEGMREVARGQLDTTVRRIRTYDEFEPVIDHFNRMVSDLAALERRVQDRTKDLQQLLAERDRFLALSLDLICLAGADGYFKEVNPAFPRVLGYSLEDLTLRPFMDFVHPDDAAATRRQFEGLIRGESTLFFVNRFRCADGSHKWLEWSAAPVPDKQLIFAIARDITDRKRGEEAERALIETRLEFEIARDIQLSLSPSSAPVIDGFDIAGASHPATEVGGDYFDYLPMRGGRLGLVIGDVTGHGLGPALVMASTRTCLRSLASASYGLEEILERANKLLYESTPDNCFVTLALLQLDAAARRFRYVSCGHSTGYLLKGDGSIKACLHSNAPPLGCLAELGVDSCPEFSLEAGDVLLMLTDGVIEAESPGNQFFGDQRALEVLRANLHAPAGAIVEALHRAAVDFSQGGPLQDDVTSLVVKVGPLPQGS
ncbi:MAG: PAS domain S-box protein [Acidobacteriales bacterium]|nr:MAG: PAS domain S-box protein [Terriglobales bacterium]